MKVSIPRREINKQTIRSLIVMNPKINNIGIAQAIGIHRNTVPKLLKEIQSENERERKKRWKMLLNDVTSIAQSESSALSQLWSNSYNSLSHSKPSQLTAITKMQWTILKDLYRLHLEYMGINEAPKSLVQVNISK